MTICERQSGGRILCIRLSGLGDVVHALNALSLLRRERPDAHIAWLVEERFAALLRGHPCIDELITVPRTSWGRMLANPLRWGGLGPELWRFSRRLRRGGFDVSVDFQSSLKSACFVLAAHAPIRIGFDRGVNRELNWTVQNRRVKAPLRGVHRIERDIALLAPLGIRSRCAEPALPIGPAAREAVDAGLQGRLSGGPLVVIHPATSRFAAFKRWDPARYARVADALIERRGADVVITSGPQDREVAAQVVRLMRRDAVEAPATADLAQLTALLARADLFIGSDTGPMHMAGALGVPVVALFGPKDPVQTGPYTSRSVAVTAPVSCRPCTRRRCPHARCMSAISVRQVLAAALGLLDGGGERRAQPGLLRKPFTWGFRLGEWRGRVTAAYSYPELFTQLCEPDGLVSGEGSAVVDAAPEAAVGHVARPESDGPRLEVQLCGAPEGAGGSDVFRARMRRAWRRALALVLDAVPTPYPVCRMELDAGLRGDVLMACEATEGAVSLREWLRRGTAARGPAAQSGMSRRLIDAVARLVRSLHRAGYCGAPLHAANVLVRLHEDEGRFEAFLVGLEALWPVRWLPPLARDLIFASDLRQLARSLGVGISVLDGARFLRSYFRGFVPERHRRRLYERMLKGVVKRARP